MPGSLPPYALDVTSFRFPAIAALAGRAPLGGAREAALAALLLARLAAAAIPAQGGAPTLDAELRRERAALARQWLSGLSLPASARGAVGKAVDATVPGTAQPLRLALDAALASLAPLLDQPARAELQQLAAAAGA